MAWIDRLREAAYTSPGGTRLRFAYEAVSRETPKRTAAFEFPGVDGAYVQDNGHGSRQYPLRCFFSGADHDIEATNFEAALLERGVGELDHPMYGRFSVVPFGSITRRDDLKGAANQSVVEVTFWTTTGAIYPSGNIEPRSEILASVDDFNEAAALEFSDATDLSTVTAQENAKATFADLAGVVSAGFAEAGGLTAQGFAAVSAARQALVTGIDVLIGQPLGLASSALALAQAPATIVQGASARLRAYAGIASSIFGSRAGSPGALVDPVTNRRRVQARNDARSADLFAAGAVSGSVLSAVSAQYDARPRAIAAAEEAMAQLDAFVEWRDGLFADVEDVDTGASYQALQRSVALTAGFLVETSFSLVPERRIVLDRPRTIIDLAAELYGSVDNRLDFLIDTNGLTGSEILELPRGRAIVYYA